MNQILITNDKILRSLTHEAGRQADYYDTQSKLFGPERRGSAGTSRGECAELAQTWRRIEQAAFHARTNHGQILIASIQDKTIPIMPCEHSEQTPNTLGPNRL